MKRYYFIYFIEAEFCRDKYFPSLQDVRYYIMSLDENHFLDLDGCYVCRCGFDSDGVRFTDDSFIRRISTSYQKRLCGSKLFRFYKLSLD